MPGSETQEGRRGGRLLTVIFWIGVCLAPLAALLVLVSSGATALRMAAVLAILAVVLLGLSVMLRPDAGSVRIELEETLLDEMDLLREDVRQDITTAARATHKAFGEKLQVVYDQVESLRDTVESLRAQVESLRLAGPEPAAAPAAASPRAAAPTPPAPPAAPISASMVGGGVVRHTETVRETTRHTIVDPHSEDDRGTVYGGTVYGARTPEPAERRPDRGAGRRRDWSDAEEPVRAGARPEPRAHDEGWDGAPASGRGPRRAADPDYRDVEYRDVDYRDSDYRDSGYRASGYRDTEYHDADSRDAGLRDTGFRDAGPRRPRPHERDEPGDEPRWSGMRAGDRWASVRADEHGRELRVGERRAAVRRDESGTELRIEDRWAAVREEDARRERAEPRRQRDESWADGDAGHPRREPDRWAEESWPPRSSGSEFALPAAAANPGWQEQWSEDDDERPRSREPRRRRAADPDDRWERDEPARPTTPRPRRLDFEMSDDRWR